MADTKSPPIDNLHTKNGNFICGVVEGNAESKYSNVLELAFHMYAVKIRYIKVYALVFEVRFSDPKHIRRLFAV
jgi:hypothetical protein